MNIAAVADTHAALWLLSADVRLSAVAKATIDRAARYGEKIGVSSISLAEVVYLVEKSRIPAGAYDDLLQALADERHVLTEVVFNKEIVHAMMRVSRAEVPDMPDRIVAATGIHLGVPVISRDRKIRGASLQTIW